MSDSTYPRDGVVDRLERLESLGHEEVGELLVHRLHAPRHLQDKPIIMLLLICSYYQMEIRMTPPAGSTACRGWVRSRTPGCCKEREREVEAALRWYIDEPNIAAPMLNILIYLMWLHLMPDPFTSGQNTY